MGRLSLQCTCMQPARIAPCSTADKGWMRCGPRPVAHSAMCARPGSSAAHVQEHFLRSSRPLEALAMRRQAQQWGAALELACALDLSQVGELSFLQAQVHPPC